LASPETRFIITVSKGETGMNNTLTIIKGAQVFAPEKLGRMDVLTAGGRILSVEKEIRIEARGADVRIIPGKGKILLPGLVDTHVHICGGGGEGGFATRTPEIQLSQALSGGITSMVGVLGTDGTTRTISSLLAKAAGLTEEGIDTWALTGSYQIPARTLTGSVADDIILVDRIIGTGEICLADHRSSHPSADDLIRLISESRRGGMLSGKSGIVNIHMGDGEGGTALLLGIAETTDLPLSQLQPTHMNRNSRLLDEAAGYARKGGFLDITAYPAERHPGDKKVPAAEALKRLLDRGIDISRITFTTDAQGSLPRFDENGRLRGLTTGKSVSLLDAFREAVLSRNIPPELAVRVVSTNPAERYKLPGKGRIAPGWDADILMLNEPDLTLDSLYAKGELMVADGRPVRFGTFEETGSRTGSF